MDNKNSESQIRNITLWGAFVNIILALFKTIVGLLINSIGLLADGIHSFSDLLTDAAVLISSRAARKPPDANHQYGHGKYETLGAIVIAIVLLIVGGSIGWTALKALIRHEMNFPGNAVIFISLISVIAKEILYRATRNIAIKTHSASLYANAWHHRSDALSSVAVILGGVGSLLGFGYSDHIAGLAVGGMIIVVAIKVLDDSMKELSEHSLDAETIEKVEDILESFKGIDNWHNLRTRKIGAELFIDMHIKVQPHLTVLESHQFTLDIEKQIQHKIKLPVNTLIHVEPFEARG